MTPPPDPLNKIIVLSGLHYVNLKDKYIKIIEMVTLAKFRKIFKFF